MRPKWSDLAATPGIRAIGSLGAGNSAPATSSGSSWLRLLTGLLLVVVLPPLVGYQLQGLAGAKVGGAISFGILAGLPLLEVAYWALWIVHRCRFRFREALCPHCIQPYEGRVICGVCGEELPPIAYLAGGKALSHCPHCQGSLPAKARQVRCLMPNCNPRLDSLGFERVRGTVILLVVKDLSTWQSFGVPIPNSDRAGILWKRAFSGPRGAVIVLVASDRQFTFGPELFPHGTAHRIVLVWLDKDINTLAVENLRNLRALWTRSPRWKRHLLCSVDSWKHLVPDLPIQAGMSRADMEAFIIRYCRDGCVQSDLRD